MIIIEYVLRDFFMSTIDTQNLLRERKNIQIITKPISSQLLRREWFYIKVV